MYRQNKPLTFSPSPPHSTVAGQNKGLILKRGKELRVLCSISVELKKTGTYSYEVLRPEYNNVKTTPLQIAGKEVFKTEKYKQDGRYSSADEADQISYFWIENDMGYEVTFLEEIPQQQEIVAELMKAKQVDINQLK